MKNICNKVLLLLMPVKICLIDHLYLFELIMTPMWKRDLVGNGRYLFGVWRVNRLSEDAKRPVKRS